MTTLSHLIIMMGFVALILADSCKEKLLPATALTDQACQSKLQIKVARRISHCTSKVARALFTSSNNILIIMPNRSHHLDLLQEILNETFADGTAEIFTNIWTLPFNRSLLLARDTKILLIVSHADLLQLLENSSMERWAEYIIVTEATTAWLSEFAGHLRNLGFVKVAFVHVTTNGTSSLLGMAQNPSSRGSQSTLKALKALDVCSDESEPSLAERQQLDATIARPFASLLRSPAMRTLRYARILEGTEKSDDFSKLENGSSSSFGSDVISIFAKKLDLELFKCAWENQDNTSWDEAMNRCVDDEFDVFYAVLPPTQNAYNGLVEPIAWYKFEALVFLYHPKKPLVSLLSLLMPYSNVLWLCTVALFGAYALFAYAIETLWRQGLMRERITVLHVWAVFMTQSLPAVPTKFGLRFVLGMWIVHSLNNALMYTGRFSSALTATGSNNYLNDFQDIMDSGKSVCGDDKSREILQRSNNSRLLRIHDNFTEAPSHEVLNKVIEEDYIGVRHLSYVERHNWLNRANDSRRLYVLDGVIITYPSLYFAKKHFFYGTEFNRIIMIAHEAGLVTKANKKFAIKLGKTREEMALSTSGDQVLRITHLKVAFEILGIGYLISGLVYLMEVYRHRRSSKKFAGGRS